MAEFGILAMPSWPELWTTEATKLGGRVLALFLISWLFRENSLEMKANRDYY